MIEWLLKKIVARLPFRTITSPAGDPYLTRWYVWPGRPRSGDNEEVIETRFAVFIHFFHRSDADRDPHNHPWDKSAALILKGGYLEERAGKVYLYRPGAINVIRRDDYHRVTLLEPRKGSWSLFVAGRNVGSWGFKLRDGRHVPHGEYNNGNVFR